MPTDEMTESCTCLGGPKADHNPACPLAALQSQATARPSSPLDFIAAERERCLAIVRRHREHVSQGRDCVMEIIREIENGE